MALFSLLPDLSFNVLLIATPISLVIYAIYRLFIYPTFLSPLRDLPGPPSASILLGNLLEILRAEPGGVHIPMIEKYGPVVKYRVMYGDDRLFITDPVALHHILVTNSYNWPKPNEVRGNLSRILGKGILFAEGEDHKRQKKIMTPAFSPSHLKDLVPVFFEYAYKLRDKWTVLIDTAQIDETAFKNAEAKATYLSTKEAGIQEAVIDVSTWFGRVTLDIIGIAGFGYQFGALDDNENKLAGAFSSMMSSTTSRPTWRTLLVMRFLTSLILKIPFFEYLPNKRITVVRKAFATMESESRKIISAKRADLVEAMSNSDTTEKDLITLLLKSNMDSDSKNIMSDAELQGQMTTFILAGHETTSTSLTWTSLTLARHPAVQDRLRLEISAAMSEARKEGRETLSSEELRSLEYLDAVCREILRFESPVSATIRGCAKADIVPLSAPITTTSGKVLSALHVAADTVLFLSITACNMSKAVFGDDADIFRPERWLEGHVGEKVQGVGVYSQLLTFLAGPRACIGVQFALLELKAILVVLIDNFEFLERDGVGPRTEHRSNIVTRPVVAGEEELGQRMPLRLRRVEVSLHPKVTLR